MRRRARVVRRVFDLLLREYGPQRWWPAESPFEVAVGAVLTQNTAWGNVEKAIANLKREGRLDLDWLATAPLGEIASLIRPSGHHNIKAERLRALCAWLRQLGAGIRAGPEDRERWRSSLLGVRGVGPETADSILLYAFGIPTFVVDAYTRRVFSRVGLLAGDEGYDEVKGLFESARPADSPGALRWYNEYHALLVEHAKRRCRKEPFCRECPLLRHCRHGLGALRSDRVGRERHVAVRSDGIRPARPRSRAPHL